MKTIQQAMLEEIYTNAIKIAHSGKQLDKDDNYVITLEQLESVLKQFES